MPTAKKTLPNPALDWAVPLSVVALIAEFESCRLTAYRCPAGVWTIGWGETEGGVHEGETITQKQADEMFCLAIRRFTNKVRTLCTVETNANELGALVSLAYNVGVGGLAKSSVLKAHNKGNKLAAARGFAAWNKGRVNGKGPLVPFAGLTRRRAVEAALYLSPVAEIHAEAAASMPQAVATPVAPAAHPLTLGGAASVATGALAALNDMTTQASSVGNTAQTVATNAQATVTSVQTAASTAHDVLHAVAHFVGLSPAMLLAALAVAAGAGLVAYVYKQHHAGQI